MPGVSRIDEVYQGGEIFIGCYFPYDRQRVQKLSIGDLTLRLIGDKFVKLLLGFLCYGMMVPKKVSSI